MGQGEYESISKLVKRCLLHIGGGGKGDGVGGGGGGVIGTSVADSNGLVAKESNPRQISPNSPFLGKSSVFRRG